jgi:hypothetical protein
MKTLILAAVRGSLMLTAVTASLFSARPAHGFTMTLEQVGSDVVANGSGAINLTGLSFVSLTESTSGIEADIGFISTAGPAFKLKDAYSGFTGPTSFGSGGGFGPNTRSGDLVGIVGAAIPGILFVPDGYVSGHALSDRMTFSNATFASLGVTPGTYEWTWGTGLPNQNFTLIIPQAGVGLPDGGSTVSLLGFALSGLAALRRKLALLSSIS